MTTGACAAGLPRQRPSALPRARSEAAPASPLHRLLVPARVVGLHRALGVVLLVDVAGVELAVHDLALEATVVLLLLHAATDVLLCARPSGDHAVRHLRAGVAVLLGADLVGDGEGL